MQEKALGKKPRAFFCSKTVKMYIANVLSQGDVTKPKGRGESP